MSQPTFDDDDDFAVDPLVDIEPPLLAIGDDDGMEEEEEDDDDNAAAAVVVNLDDDYYYQDVSQILNKDDDDDDDDDYVEAVPWGPGVLPQENTNNEDIFGGNTPTTSPTQTFQPSHTFRPTDTHYPTGTSVWIEVTDPESGEPYYYNSGTRETTWEPPAEFVVASAAPRPPLETTSTVFGGGSENNNNNPVDADNNEDIVVVTDDAVEFDKMKAAVIGGVSVVVIVVLVLYGYLKFCRSKRGRSSSKKTTNWQAYDETNLHNDSPSRRSAGRRSGLFKDASPTASPASVAMLAPPMSSFRDEVSSIGGDSYKDDIISMSGSPNPPRSTSLVKQYGETRDEVLKATYV